jgi:hypothetical protein
MSNISLINASCADQTVDAVVNAANSGLWVGGGTGLSFPSPYDLFLPLYSEVKYSFMADRLASPFLSARVGAMTNFDECRMILNPAVGVDIKRFTVFATMNLGLISMRTFGLGFCWNFR